MHATPKTTRYAHITDEIKAAVIREFKAARSWGCPEGQSVSIAASNAYRLTNKQWNGKSGSDAFASALGILVMAGVLSITEKEPTPAIRGL